MTEVQVKELEIAEALKKVAIEAIDLEKLAFGIIDQVLEPALDNLVAKSENKIDDAVKALVYGPLEVELKQLIAKEVAKLKAKI